MYSLFSDESENASEENVITGDECDSDAESSHVEPRNKDCRGLYIEIIKMTNK